MYVNNVNMPLTLLSPAETCFVYLVALMYIHLGGLLVHLCSMLLVHVE